MTTTTAESARYWCDGCGKYAPFEQHPWTGATGAFIPQFPEGENNSVINRFGVGGVPAQLAPPANARQCRPPAESPAVPGTVWVNVDPVDIQPGDTIRYYDYRPEIAQLITAEVTTVAVVQPAPAGVDGCVVWLTFRDAGFAGLSSDVAVEKRL